MQEIITTIQNDSTMMLIVGVGLAVFLVIFLVLLVSAMKIKGYKDNYRRIHAENLAIAEARSTLEKELKVYKITDQKNKKELAQAADTIKRLKIDLADYPKLQKYTAELEKELHQTQTKLETAYGKYADLDTKHNDLQKRFATLTEESTKYRANNARLLTKLENSKR